MRKLNNGHNIPSIGYGVFRMTNLEECEEAVYHAIRVGYRLIDTAAAYENETAVGRGINKAISEGLVKREDLFITTKLWVTDTTYDRAKYALNKSLERLGLDYVDLYLIHQPYNDYFGAWRALEELYEEGKVKAIGVDNLTEDRLADLIFYNRIKPQVNMLECHPYCQRENERQYLEKENILMQAWSPLGAGNKEMLEDEIICEIASKYHKSSAQVVLRWLVQKGIVPVVKSSHVSRMKENLDIFDFELNEKEMKNIDSLGEHHHYVNRRATGEAVESFLERTLEYNV